MASRASGAVFTSIQSRIALFNNVPVQKQRLNPPSTIKKRKRTPAKFFKSPLRIKLAEENFCSVAKVNLTDTMEHRYKIHSFWDWVTVGLYLVLGLVGLRDDTGSLTNIISSCSWKERTCHGKVEPAAALSIFLVLCIWVVSFSASLLKLFNARLVMAPKSGQSRGTYLTRVVWSGVTSAFLLLCRALPAAVWIASGFLLFVSKLWMIGPALEFWLKCGGPLTGLHWDTKCLAAEASNRIVIADATESVLSLSDNPKRDLFKELKGTATAPGRMRIKKAQTAFDTFFNVSPRVDLLFDVRHWRSVVHNRLPI